MPEHFRGRDRKKKSVNSRKYGFSSTDGPISEREYSHVRENEREVGLFLYKAETWLIIILI